jgi:hypothetical protein
VFPPNAPPKRPPLCCGCDCCAVDAPNSPPLAGAAVAGLFILPNKPPEGCDVWAWPPNNDVDCACCGCCADPKSPPLLWGWLACCPWVALFPLAVVSVMLAYAIALSSSARSHKAIAMDAAAEAVDNQKRCKHVQQTTTTGIDTQRVRPPEARHFVRSSFVPFISLWCSSPVFSARSSVHNRSLWI